MENLQIILQIVKRIEFVDGIIFESNLQKFIKSKNKI